MAWKAAIILTSRDVYLELAMIFVFSFLILNFLKSVGEQLIFMLIAFIFSGVVGELFIGGVKGIMEHPFTATEEGRKEKLHEKKYVFLLFFVFILGSTVVGTILSTYLVNNILYPSIGSIQGAIIVSAIITLTLYLTMLWMFEEKLINRTSIGLLMILIILIVLFVFFSGYTGPVINYLTVSMKLLESYLKL